MAVARGPSDRVGRALWFIESRFAQPITLDEAAAAGGISRYHLSRVFALVTGCSFAQYVRDRRLTEAARTLADGAPDILAVALDAGYGSHEAFTRAFRERFGCTPESVRAARHVRNLTLMEALRMDTIPTATLPAPRLEFIERRLIAGIGQRYAADAIAGIPAQWQRFVPHIGTLPVQVGDTTYGVILNSDGTNSFEYICGVEVRDFAGVADDWAHVRIERVRYAVFEHRDHVSAIKNTMVAIYNTWLPASGHEVANAPELERYGEAFDGRTGLGGFEIWIPLKD